MKFQNDRKKEGFNQWFIKQQSGDYSLETVYYTTEQIYTEFCLLVVMKVFN